MTQTLCADPALALHFVLPSLVIPGVPMGNPLTGSPVPSTGPSFITWSTHDHFTHPSPGLRQLFCPLLHRPRIRPLG
ncbi:hypothetical protein FQP90_00235 [Paenarthrobacter nitroguajacolicus]|uniref:Uncharacterized protein n=1 Tax=Paenarthrobacter nitroguajacolicus TaxID=211146 RepID=A0A558HBV2_PAENT|nr:hypothetical protein FQP90_00235 [Paenarthrobacter nitroguajacolicus]